MLLSHALTSSLLLVRPPPHHRCVAALMKQGSGVWSSDISPFRTSAWSYPSEQCDNTAIDMHVSAPKAKAFQALVEVWRSMDETPLKMRAFSDDGQAYPLDCVIAAKSGEHGKHVAVRNIGRDTLRTTQRLVKHMRALPETSSRHSIEMPSGGARLYDVTVGQYCTCIILTRPDTATAINARIEVMNTQGTAPGQIVELYTESAFFVCALQTDGRTAVRVINRAHNDEVFEAAVVPYIMRPDEDGKTHNVPYQSAVDALVGTASQ